MQRSDIALVSMPWAAAHSPSIQLGLLHATLRREGLKVRSHSLFLDLAEFIAARPELPARTYETLSGAWLDGAGDWIFTDSPEDEYFAFMSARGHSNALLDALRTLRALVPEFLERCARRVLEDHPRMVGFSSTFNQNAPSLALAKLLKSICPDLWIIFGGANCELPMGQVIFDNYPCVDLVATRTGEDVLPALVRAARDEQPFPEFEGVVSRVARTGETVPPPVLALDDLPTPDYDEYFATLARCPRMQSSGMDICLPLESSRGCWWGQAHHCTFCGLNGNSMAFRSKSPERVVDEVSQLSSRHAIHRIGMVDNIIDMKYMDTLLPMVAERPELDLSMFYETKANLGREQVRALRAAGVDQIQPGIESLSTPILREMDKGTSAYQNLRLLKWCGEFGITVHWNLLYGFAHESPDEYARMAELCESLFHLPPPDLIPLCANRNSPIFNRPEALGFRIEREMPAYAHVYPELSAAERRDIAYFFETSFTGNKSWAEVETYVAPLRRVIEAWKAHAREARRSLTYRVMGDSLAIEDSTRIERQTRRKRYVFRGVEATIYQLCDGGLAPGSILQRLEARYPGRCQLAEVTAFCDDLVRHGLMCQVDGRYLALALRHQSVTARRIAAMTRPAEPTLRLPVVPDSLPIAMGAQP